MHRLLLFCSGNNLTWAQKARKMSPAPIYTFLVCLTTLAINMGFIIYVRHDLKKNNSSYRVWVSSMTSPISSILFFFSYYIDGLKWRVFCWWGNGITLAAEAMPYKPPSLLVNVIIRTVNKTFSGSAVESSLVKEFFHVRLKSSSLSGTGCLLLLDFLSGSVECRFGGCGGIDAQLIFILVIFVWPQDDIAGGGSTGYGCATLSHSICSLEIRLFIYSPLAGVAHWTLSPELSFLDSSQQILHL